MTAALEVTGLERVFTGSAGKVNPKPQAASA